MSSFQPKIMKLAKKQESMPHTLRKKKQATETPVRVTNVGFNRERLQSGHYKYVQQTKGKCDKRGKGRYDNITSNGKYQ